MHIKNNKILEKVRGARTPSTSGQDMKRGDELLSMLWKKSRQLAKRQGNQLNWWEKMRNFKGDVFYFLVKYGARSLAESEGSDYSNG